MTANGNPTWDLLNFNMIDKLETVEFSSNIRLFKKPWPTKVNKKNRFYSMAITKNHLYIYKNHSDQFKQKFAIELNKISDASFTNRQKVDENLADAKDAVFILHIFNKDNKQLTDLVFALCSEIILEKGYAPLEEAPSLERKNRFINVLRDHGVFRDHQNTEQPSNFFPFMNNGVKNELMLLSSSLPKNCVHFEFCPASNSTKRIKYAVPLKYAFDRDDNTI